MRVARWSFEVPRLAVLGLLLATALPAASTAGQTSRARPAAPAAGQAPRATSAGAGPIAAFERSVMERLARTRPSTRPVAAVVRIDLRNVEWNDTRGRPFVRAERITGRLQETALSHGSLVLSDVDAVRPRIWLYRTRGDTLWNYQHVLAALLARTGRALPAGKRAATPLVEVRKLALHDGFASIVQPSSARGPSYELRLQDIQAKLPRITLSAPGLPAPVVRLAQASAIMERPDLGWRLPFTMRGATVTLPAAATHFDISELAFGRTRLTDIRGIYDSELPGMGVRATGLAPVFRLDDVRTFAPTLNLTGAGSFAWRVEPTPDNGVLVALQRLHFTSDGSEMAGAVTFTAPGDTARPTLVAADLRLQPLRLALIERLTGAHLPFGGAVTGRVTGVAGRIHLDFAAQLTAPGVAPFNMALAGNVIMPAAAYELTGRLAGLPLRNVTAVSVPPVTLSADFALGGRGFDPALATANFRLNGRFSGWGATPADDVTVRGSVARGVLRLDTLTATLATATLAAGGVWPFAASGSGDIAYRLEVSDLGPFAPFLPPGGGGRAAGTARLAGSLGGTLAAPHLVGSLVLAGARADGWSVDSLATTYGAHLGTGGPRIVAQLQARTVTTSVAGTFATANASLHLAAPALSLTVSARRPGGGVVDLVATGILPDTGARVVTIQQLSADVGPKRWRLARPAVVRWLPGGTLALQNLLLQQQQGSGRLFLQGRLLPADSSDYELQAVAIPVADFFQLAGRPPPVTGLLYATAAVRGPADAPQVNATFRLDTGTVQGVNVTLLRGSLGFRAGRLTADARVSFTPGGRISANAALPAALALGLPPSGRVLPTGSVSGSLMADSVPLALLQSLTDQVTNAAGAFSASMSLSGSSQQPVLAGTAALRGGALTLTASRQHYSDISGTLTLRNRRIRVDSLRARSDGFATLSGTVDVPQLRSPVANLTVSFDRFRPLGTASRPQAAARGRLTITGPLLSPSIGGKVRLDEGNLSVPTAGPAAALPDQAPPGLGDLAPLPGQGAGPAAPLFNRVRISALQLTAGPNLWFEMPNARVQLSGTLTVNRPADEPMSVVGTLAGRRGNYTVVAGPIVRRLDITDARIRFLGIGGINPEIDATARKTILDPQGRTMDILAHVTGTVENPQLALSTSEGLQIPQSELLSFLVFGQPSFALGSSAVGRALVQQTVFGGITEAASMQLQQSLLASGVPLDVFEIQPSTAGTPANVVLGREMAPDVFLTVQTAVGVLFGNTGTAVGYPLAVRLEWRATPRLTAILGYEPVTPVATLHGFYNLIPQQLRQDKQLTVELRRRWTY